MRTLARVLAMLPVALALAGGSALAKPRADASTGSQDADRTSGKLAPGAKGAGRSRMAKGKAQSVGAPNAGHLTGAVRLKPSKHLHLRANAHSWALPQLVHLLKQASDEVSRNHRGSRLLVGDLSGRTGGYLPGHNSHQTGRDADVGFYVMNVNGKPVDVKRFVAFDDGGRGRELPWAVFDDARNWSLVEALLRDERSVRYLFITNALRARLLAFAAKKHAPRELVNRAAAAMMSPKDADLHDDHFHVRVTCPEAMRDVCVEESTARGSDAVAAVAAPENEAGRAGAGAPAAATEAAVIAPRAGEPLPSNPKVDAVDRAPLGPPADPPRSAPGLGAGPGVAPPQAAALGPAAPALAR